MTDKNDTVNEKLNTLNEAVQTFAELPSAEPEVKVSNHKTSKLDKLNELRQFKNRNKK